MNQFMHSKNKNILQFKIFFFYLFFFFLMIDECYIRILWLNVYVCLIMFNSLDANSQLVTFRLRLPVCSGSVGLLAYTSSVITRALYWDDVCCSFILLIIKLCLNCSMYNPYTTEHLNGDVRKEYFIADKCPIVQC